MIDRLTVIGVGLIGGSLARALRRADAVGEIVGAGRSIANLERAMELNVIDRYAESALSAVEGADLVVIAAPLGATASVLQAIAPALDDATVVTDAGSTKRAVVDAARSMLGARFADFVPGHPIAGTEHSGVEAAFADLYVGHRVILTPVEDTRAEAVARVRGMWEVAGARVVEMDVDHHDEVLAATSHLPHVLAYCLVDTLAAFDDSGEIFAYAAGGFRDFTRIASSNPGMWRDITLANRDALLRLCDRFDAHFGRLRAAIENGDGDAIEQVFARAKGARDRCVVPEGNESAGND